MNHEFEQPGEEATQYQAAETEETQPQIEEEHNIPFFEQCQREWRDILSTRDPEQIKRWKQEEKEAKNHYEPFYGNKPLLAAWSLTRLSWTKSTVINEGLLNDRLHDIFKHLQISFFNHNQRDAKDVIHYIDGIRSIILKRSNSVRDSQNVRFSIIIKSAIDEMRNQYNREFAKEIEQEKARKTLLRPAEAPGHEQLLRPATSVESNPDELLRASEEPEENPDVKENSQD